MKNIGYQNQLSQLVDNTLLHLYIDCAESGRFVPPHKRNDILIQHLKPKIKDDRYRYVKKEIKRFISIGRKPKLDLEQSLLELKDIKIDPTAKVSDAQRLFDLLEELKMTLKIDSRFLQSNEQKKLGFIYMFQSDIDNGFTQEGEQIGSLSLFVPPKKIEAIIQLMSELNVYSFESLSPVAPDLHHCIVLNLDCHNLDCHNNQRSDEA